LKEERAMTAWVTTKDMEELRTSRNSKPIREELKGEVESVIRFVQDNEHRWIESEEIEVEETAPAKFDEETELIIENEVERILEAENILSALGMHLDVVIVGEYINKRVILVLLIGAKYGTLNKLSIIVLKGASRGGKSRLADEVSSGFNVKRIGRFTRHGLDYTDLEPYDILYIRELGDLEQEESGISKLKFLHADDRGFEVEYPIRDQTTGRMTTEIRIIPPKNVISTTVGIYLERQFSNRAWLLPIDGSPELTEKVLQWKAETKKQEDEKTLGLRKITDYERSKEIIKRVVSRIEPQEIVVPFRKTITRIFDSSVLRIRGDIDKIYTFIELYSLFNVKRLRKLEINGKEYYTCTPEIAVEALDIIKGTISQMLVGIEPRTKAVLEALNEIDVGAGYTDPVITGEEARQIMIHPNAEGTLIGKDVRKRIAKRLGVSNDTVRTRFNALCDTPYVSSDEGKGRPGKIFTLHYDVSEILRKLGEEAGILRSPHSLKVEMEKEEREWLKSKCGMQFEEDSYKISIEHNGKKFTKSEDDAKSKISNTTSQESILHSRLEQNQTDSTEITEENAEDKKRGISSKEKISVKNQNYFKK